MSADDLDLSGAPEAQAIRDKILAEDKALAKQMTPDGSAARFRLRYGQLADFVITESLIDTPYDHVANAYLGSIVTAVLTLAINAKHPDRAAQEFLGRLVTAVGEGLDANQERFAATVVDLTDGRVRDYDFTRRWGSRKKGD